MIRIYLTYRFFLFYFLLIFGLFFVWDYSWLRKLAKFRNLAWRQRIVSIDSLIFFIRLIMYKSLILFNIEKIAILSLPFCLSTMNWLFSNHFFLDLNVILISSNHLLFNPISLDDHIWTIFKDFLHWFRVLDNFFNMFFRERYMLGLIKKRQDIFHRIV